MSAIADYLLGGASGINRSALKFADTLVGNPAAGLANALGADIDRNPLTRAAQAAGVGRDAVNPNQALAQAVAGTGGDMAAGMVPGAGDVAGLHDDIKAVEESGYHPAMIGLAAAGALPFVPSLIRSLPESFTSRFKGPGDKFGAREAGVLTFHGTPHDFPATEANDLGEFDISKVGTGEGAQAYGHGIYLAESPDVAKEYRDQLSDPSAGRLAGDSVYDFYKKLEGQAESLPPDQAQDIYERMAFVEDLGFTHDFGEALERVDDEAVRSWAETLRGEWKPPGNIYGVDLPDEYLPQMLDWDAPLSDQPEQVREALSQALESAPDGMLAESLQGFEAGSSTGRSLYHALWQDLIRSGEALPAKVKQQRTSEILSQAGIPGIKYFDQGSRAAGEGTRNFVVFDPSITKILSKN